MWLIDRRIKGIPITFLAVLLLMVLLTVFFGAWAVSADLDAQERNLSFGIAGRGPGFDAINSEGPSETGGTILGEDGDGTNPTDSWWGGALLKACPFH